MAKSDVAKERFFNLPVIVLISLSFMLGMSEFIVVGILPDIAAGLKVSEVTVGNLVSLFALVYAPVTPLGSALSARFPRFCHASDAGWGVSYRQCAVRVRVELWRARSGANPHRAGVRHAGGHCHDVRARCNNGTVPHEVHRMGVFRILHRIRGGRAGWHVGCEHIRLALGVPFGERAHSGAYCAHGDGAAAQQPYCEDWFSAAIPPVFRPSYSVRRACRGVWRGGKLRVLHVSDADHARRSACSRTVFKRWPGDFRRGLPVEQPVWRQVCRPWQGSGTADAYSSDLLRARRAYGIADRNALGAGVWCVAAGGAWHVHVFAEFRLAQVLYMDVASQSHPGSLNLAASLNSMSFNIGIALGSAVGGLVNTHLGLMWLGPAGAIFLLCAVGTTTLLRPFVARERDFYAKQHA